MSGFGALVRSAVPVADLPTIAARATHAHDVRYASGWRNALMEIPDFFDEAELADGLIRDTGAPVITMYVLDTWAIAIAVSPAGVRRRFFVNERLALLEYEDMPVQPEFTNEDALADLLRWAGEARLTPDSARLAGVLADGDADARTFRSQLAAALGMW